MCLHCLQSLFALTTQWSSRLLSYFLKSSFIQWLGKFLNNANMIPLLPLKRFQCFLLVYRIKSRFLCLLFGPWHSDLLKVPTALICIWCSTHSPNLESPHHNFVSLQKPFLCVFPIYVPQVNTSSIFKTQLCLNSSKKHFLTFSEEVYFSYFVAMLKFGLIFLMVFTTLHCIMCIHLCFYYCEFPEDINHLFIHIYFSGAWHIL